LRRGSIECPGQTGVEMKTLNAPALLTIYDLCNAVDRGMTKVECG